MASKFDLRLKLQHCPTCDAKLNAAMHVDSELSHMPREGDFSICIECGAVLVFDDAQNIELASQELLDNMPALARQELEHYSNKAREFSANRRIKEGRSFWDE